VFATKICLGKYRKKANTTHWVGKKVESLVHCAWANLCPEESGAKKQPPILKDWTIWRGGVNFTLVGEKYPEKKKKKINFHPNWNTPVGTRKRTVLEDEGGFPN